VRLTKRQLRKKMEALSRKYDKITVGISNLQINGDNAVADVQFLQEFIGTPASGNQPVSIIYWERELFWHRFFHTQGQQLQGFVYRFASKRRAEFDKSPRFIMLIISP